MTEFRMPSVFRGQVVLWYEGGTRDESRACPAIVKVESHSSLHLKVFGLDHDFDQTCVRHMADPYAKEYDRINEGGWDFTPTGNHLAKNPFPEMPAIGKNAK